MQSNPTKDNKQAAPRAIVIIAININTHIQHHHHGPGEKKP